MYMINENKAKRAKYNISTRASCLQHVMGFIPRMTIQLFEWIVVFSSKTWHLLCKPAKRIVLKLRAVL